MIYITESNYTLITVPEKYDEDIRKPKHTMEFRRAEKYIKKHYLKKEILTVDLQTMKPYKDPNFNTVVLRQAQRNGIKIDGMILYIRDIIILRKISKPNKTAL